MDFDFATSVSLALVGAALAVVAWWGDRRRMRRSDPDAVGWVPWRAVSLWATVLAVAFAGLAVHAWIKGY